MIKSFGYGVRLFASPRECLDSFDEKRAACLILDTTLPGINGFELHTLLGNPIAAFRRYLSPHTMMRVTRRKPGASWSSEQEIVDYWSNRLRCRLDNSRMPQSQWQDCTAIK
jgi:hypothetical protein